MNLATQQVLGVLTGLALVNPCAAFLQNMPAANAGQFCANSHYVTMGNQRVKVCCTSANFCTTPYGVYNK